MKWLLLAFLGVAAASQVPGFSPDKEYVFQYRSSVLSGIPQLGRQHSGLKLSALIRVQKVSAQAIHIQLEDSKFQNFNEDIEWRDMSPYSPQRREERESVPSPVKRHLESPFKVVINEVLVEKIQVESSEPEYITNMKKSVVSHLLALSKSELVHERHFRPSVRSMETTVVGECETEYTISKLPEYLARDFEQREQIPKQELCEGKEYYEIVKSKNMKVCKERPIYQHRHGIKAVSDGSMGSSAPLADEASVTKVVICGRPEEYIVRKVTNEHKFVMSPSGKFANEEKMQVTSASRLTLHAVEPKSKEIPNVSSPKPRGSLMYEFPAEENFASTSSRKPSRPSSSQQQSEDELEQWYVPQVPKPHLTSAPKPLFPSVKSIAETKEQVIQAFLQIVEKADKCPESSYKHEDVAATFVEVARALVKFGLEDIKELWTKIEPRIPVHSKETAEHAFFDLVATAGTNPCVMYILEAVKSRKLIAEPAPWIVSDAIRSVKTPTEELLKELVDFIKHDSVQTNKNLVSSAVLSVTQLVYKACIDETSSVFDVPAKAFGRFCDERSPVITRELIPFLAEKLTSAGPHNMHQLLTYINALGNLGHHGAALHLLRVIEGVPSRDPLPRSVAVYQLIKAAKANPVLYRPVILALIANEAESEEVRMAAVTVLPYTRPSSAHMNTLAIRTWWEPSSQVSSYIVSTLRALADLPVHDKLYPRLAEKAQQAYNLTRPVNTGIQTSRNFIVSEFLESLKASVRGDVQWVRTAESVVPKLIFAYNKVQTKSHSFKTLELAINLQGSEYIVNKLYDVYTTLLPQQEQQEMEKQQNYIKNILPVQSRRPMKPEAHVTVDFVAIKRIFSFDKEMVEKIIAEITKESLEVLSMHHTLSRNLLRTINVYGSEAIIPTEFGVPVFITHQTPLVLSLKTALSAKMANMRNAEATVKVEPVVNYKQITQAGVFCPFTQKFLATGVNTHVHVSAAVKAEVAVRDGQYTVSISVPKEEESHERPVFQLSVKPYTVAYDIKSQRLGPISRSPEAKIIKSTYQPKQRKEIPLGRPLGLALRLKVETEQPHYNLATFIEALSQNTGYELFNLPIPLRSVKDHEVSLIYSPRESTTKAVSVSFSLGYGSKKKASDEPEVTPYSRVRVPTSIESQCKEEAKRYRPEEQEEKLEECERKKIAAEEKRQCIREETRESRRPTSEIESYCNKRSIQYTWVHKSYKSTKKCLHSMLKGIQNPAKAVSIDILVALHGQNYEVEQEAQTQLTISEDKTEGQKKENQVKLMVALKTPQSQNPYEVELKAIRKIERPSSEWDIEAMLREEISSKIILKGEFGRKQEQKEKIELDIKAERSPQQMAFAKNTEEWKKCEADIAKNQQLSESCRLARQYASSLDELRGDLAIPKEVARSPYTATVVRMAQAYFLPYLYVEESSFNQESGNEDHVKIYGKIAPHGKVVTVSLEANRQKVILEKVRVVREIQSFLPFRVTESLPEQILSKVTKHGHPSMCAVEGNKVETFDKVVYDYKLNDCEHVLVRDCSESPRVLVTIKKTPALHIVKAVIDGNKYELELVKASRGSRSQDGKVKVNDQIKQGQQKGKFVIFDDKYNQITKYEDGVFEIQSLKYGMKIRSDSMSTQVITLQQKLRDLACGLCGDLNDEKIADVRSAKQCVMSSPKLAAYSYMVQDRKCSGIPSADKERYQRESEHCVRKEVIPSKVYDIFTTVHQSIKRMQTTLQNVVELRGQEVCISKRQVKVCGAESKPKDIVPREMPFFCVAADSEGRTLQRIVRRGEKIERAEKRPTAFTSTVYEPRQC